MMKNRATCGFLSVTVVIALVVMALGVAAVVLFSQGSLGEKMNLIANKAATLPPTVVAPVVIVVTATPEVVQTSTVAVVAKPTATPTLAPTAAVAQGMCG